MMNTLLTLGSRMRIARWTMPSLLLAAIGCGFPHDRYGSDPMLGAFLRPIAPTPPIWTGQDPGVSPAYDGGARIGLPSPDVPNNNNVDSPIDRMFLVPTFNGRLGLGGGVPMSSTGATEQSGNRQVAYAAPRPAVHSAGGAHLMSSTPVSERSTIAAPTTAMTPDSVTVRPLDTHSLLTSGSAIEPSIMAPKPFSPAASMKDPRSVYSVDEGQAILQTCGARSMVMEPQPTGEWRFICTISDGTDLRRYEARNTEAIEAVRAVMWQVKNQQ